MTGKSKAKAKSAPDAAVRNRKIGVAAAVAAGVVAVGAGLFLAKDKSTPRPDHLTLVEDGPFAIRQYPELIVAETVVKGAADRKAAQSEGFQRLADYIFAKSRPGEKIAMTAPVLIDRAGTDADEDRWRTRFIMPDGYSREALPDTPDRVDIAALPTRRVAVISFSGIWTEDMLATKEAELRAWLTARGEEGSDKVEYAFYDAPMIPGPLRRNEILIPLG